jgi:glyoxylase-like metal-dependent hydrolase (beta-lactamase superfamily II)
VRQAGVEPSALKGVLMTHLHSDHTAGLPALPGVEVFAGAGALAGFESDVVATVTHLDAVPRINTFDLSVGTPSVAGNTLDVFGDGALLAVDTAGHTAGHLSFIVNLEGGPVLLTGDASHSQVGFEAGVAPGKVADRAGADATLARLRAFAAAFPSARVYFGHEAGQHDVGAGAQAPLR